MPKPPTPPDLQHCTACGKVLGDHKGWFGPQCMCHLDLKTVPTHSIPLKTSKP